ncbi:EAL domain-containing protein [Streptomyces sp. NPDC055749]
MIGYFAWMALLTSLYYVFPGHRVIWWGVMGLSGVLAILAGVLLNRPSHYVSWLLLAVANLSFLTGQLMNVVYTQYLHQVNPFPSIADGFYLAQYPLYAAGVLGFIRWRTASRDRGSLIDGLILTAGLALLSWTFLIVPYVRNPELTWIQKAFSIAYPLGDLLVLAMLARLLAPRTGGSRSLQLLTIGSIGILTSDVLFGLIQLDGTWRIGTAVDLGWAVLYTCWGAAALHPSMVTLTRPAPVQPPTLAPARLGLLTLASLIAPLMLLLEAGNAGTDARVVGAFSAVLFFLVLARLAGVVTNHRKAIARERVLRTGIESLAWARSVEEVAEAVEGTATTLTRGPRHNAVLAVRDSEEELRIVRENGDGDASPLRNLDEVLALPAVREQRPLPFSDLDPGVAAGLPDAPSALLCPLVLDRPAGEMPIGVLAVAGVESELLDVRTTLATLAAQAVLAVERISLAKEINRRDSEAYFRTLVHNASDVILILDADARIRYASSSALPVLGYPALEGRRLTDLVAHGDTATMVRMLDDMRTRDWSDRREDWRVLRSDGACIEVEVRCSDLRDEPTVGGLVLTLQDVTQRRRLERELTHRAFHDSLTGLANRVLFQDRTGHALTRGQREGTVVGVLFVDVDDFKVINDTLGHGVGDELLVAVSLRLATTIRASDTVARIGGDEFAMLTGDSMAPRDVETFSDHVIEAFREPFKLSSGMVNVSISVGVATTEDSVDADELFAHADLALYSAKTAGKGQWRRYLPKLQSDLLERHELQESLDATVVETSFAVRYQPIVDLASSELVGFEALVRWPHKTRGVVLPEQFIALAEESGRIVPLGAWVLRQAASDAARWRREGVHRPPGARPNAPAVPLYVSVNVSARQFRDAGFVDMARTALETSGIGPESLVLELTESVLMTRGDNVLEDMKELTDLGIRIAIDDFGTGYSSLSYLREFPIKILKIDKSFIDGLGVSSQQYALIEGIANIAETLGIVVIAEGIENRTQRDLLASLGCPLGQGYLFAQPMEAAEAERLVRSSQRLGV